MFSCRGVASCLEKGRVVQASRASERSDIRNFCEDDSFVPPVLTMGHSSGSQNYMINLSMKAPLPMHAYNSRLLQLHRVF